MREDWVEVELGSICDVNMGQSPPSVTYNTEGRGLPFFQGKAEFTDLYPIVQKWCDAPKKVAQPFDILLSVRAPVGSTNIANCLCAIGRGLAAITYQFDYKYIWYYLKLIEKKLNDQGTGTTFKAVSGGIIKSQIVPLAPLPEQRAIVAKLEELFSELDNGIANLNKAKEKLEIYRQAVLKKAFEGELTKEWRESHTNLPSADELLEQIKKEREKYYEEQLKEWRKAVSDWEANGEDGARPASIKKPKYAEDVKSEEVELYGGLPSKWIWTRFCNVTHKIGDVDHKMPKDFPSGIPYLSTGNLKADGTIDFENAKTISRDDYDRLSSKIKPEKGDIIFPRYGTIGRNILVVTDREFIVSYSCAIIKNISHLMDERFVYYFSISPVIKMEIKRYKVETTQANIGIASIESFVFPLCSKSEQVEIVKEIETRLSVCDDILNNINYSIKKADTLRQSILKKAFEGELLSKEELEACRREPDWEPAEKLLERIKKEIR